MNDDETLLRLTPIFREVFEEPALVVTSAMSAKDVERWNSLSHIDMIVSVEAVFGIRIPTREVASMKTVADLVRAIRSRLA